MSEPTLEKRPTCPNCSKPTHFYLCTQIWTLGLDNKVSVTILQHRLETKHPLNSARLARLGLKNVSLHSVSDAHFGARFVIRLVELGHRNGVERLDLDGVGSVVVVDIEKYGRIEKIESTWTSPIRGRKRPSFDEFLASEEAVDALARRFTLKKVQKKRVGWGVELEEFEEFEIVVPPGIALLFPVCC